MIEITVQSRIKTWPLPGPAIRRAARALSDRCLPGVVTGDISICLVSAKRMAQINERYLGHTGPTDVITFDYRTCFGEAPNNEGIVGEIIICPEVASNQSRFFGVGWEHEVLRYLAHGFLHLAGHDDLEKARRKAMKRVENRLVRQMAARLGSPWAG